MPSELLFLGHSRSILRLQEVAELLGYTVLGIIDDNYFGNTESLDQLPILGTEKNIKLVLEKYPTAQFFVSTPRTARIQDWQIPIDNKRQAMIETVRRYQLPLVNLIHPHTEISKYATLGQGIFIGFGSLIQHRVRIDNFAYIREQVSVSHDTIVESNVFLGAQSYIGSTAHIGENSYIGMKSAVITSSNSIITIGKNCVTHPGVIMLKDLPDNSIAMVGSGKIRGAYSPTVI